MLNSEIIIKCLVFLAGMVLGIAAIVKTFSKKNESSDRIEDKKQLKENKVDWVKLYEEKCDLEQKLVRLAGGDTGMIAYKKILEKAEVVENHKKADNIEMYQSAYKRKHEQFCTSYKRYAEILKEAEACPKDMRNLFSKSRDEDIYQDLLKFNP